MLYLQDIWGIQLVYSTSYCYYFKIKIHKKNQLRVFFYGFFLLLMVFLKLECFIINNKYK